MFLEAGDKKSTFMISIHAELVMYGDVFIEIKNNGEGITVEWLSLCDGGDVADKGEKAYPSISYQAIVDYFYSIDFPDQEDERMNVGWEIQCFSSDEEIVASVGFGYWNREIIENIVSHLKEYIKDDEPFLCMLDTLNA